MSSDEDFAGLAGQVDAALAHLEGEALRDDAVRVLTSVRRLITRAEAIQSLRAAKGKGLSMSAAQDLRQIVRKLEALAGVLLAAGGTE